MLFGVAITPEEQLQYGAKAGILIPLNDLIEKYGVEYKGMAQEVDYIRPATTALDGYLMNAFTYNDCQDANGRLLIDDNGKVWAPHVTADWREGLRWMNKLYREGLQTRLVLPRSSKICRQSS